jgi:mannose-1-phosphate guanylyltransferase/mannose-6-phosphate isomerase
MAATATGYPQSRRFPDSLRRAVSAVDLLMTKVVGYVTKTAMVDDVLILAGGAGTRLWPASVQASPKQFLDPGTGEPLIISAIRRAEALSDGARIGIVTHQDHVAPLQEACRSLNRELKERLVVLPEPVGKNTAPAIAYGMSFMLYDTHITTQRADPAADRTVLILAADHLIEPAERFYDAVERADRLAREGFLVTFGVEPTRAETGYGYIEAGSAYGDGFRVSSFREKPDLQTAEVYVKSGGFYWNSGMFVFPQRLFLQELAEHVPEIAGAFGLDRDAAPPEWRVTEAPQDATESNALTTLAVTEELARTYSGLQSISIDYAVMEQSGSVGMVPAGFSWNDLGSWDEIADIQGDRNAAAEATDAADRAPVIEIDSENCFVRSDIPVALCGVKDLIVVQAEGKLLVCRRHESQLVKEAVGKMKEMGRQELL